MTSIASAVCAVVLVWPDKIFSRFNVAFRDLEESPVGLLMVGFERVLDLGTFSSAVRLGKFLVLVQRFGVKYMQKEQHAAEI